VSALDAVAARIAALPQPARIGIDGVTAAGKSTVADALVPLLEHPVTRVTIDDFHRPPPQEYYPSSFDFARFREHVLSLDGAVIADGVFLHHPELRDLWQLTIFLSVEREVARERGIERDASWMENARERYAQRYFPGETRYLDEVDPASRADIVIDTTNLEELRLLRTCLRPS
jgi:uridine kinase